MTNQVNEHSGDLHVTTEDGEQCIVWQANKLTYIAQDRQGLPLILAARFGKVATKLDLSYNNLTSYRNINLFTNLNELILDNNCLSDSSLDFKQNLRLKTLSLNKNKLADLNEIVANIKVCFPNLEFLSLIGNPLCPTPISRDEPATGIRGSRESLASCAQLLSDEQQSDFAYRKYRYFIIYHLPNLRFLDSSQISSREKEAALKCCYWMMGFNSSSGADKTVTLSSDGSSCERLSEPNGDSSYNGSSTSFQLTTMSARANGHQVQGLQVVNNDVQPKGTFSRLSYKYRGRNSEGNRFIGNGDL